MPESSSIKTVMEPDFIDFWSMKDIKFENENQNTLEILNKEREYPEFSTFKYRKKEGGFIQRTIDYMFCSIDEATRLQVTKWFEPPREDQLNQEMGSPC